jgi:hypothetical protein
MTQDLIVISFAYRLSHLAGCSCGCNALAGLMIALQGVEMVAVRKRCKLRMRARPCILAAALVASAVATFRLSREN